MVRARRQCARQRICSLQQAREARRKICCFNVVSANYEESQKAPIVR